MDSARFQTSTALSSAPASWYARAMKRKECDLRNDAPERLLMLDRYHPVGLAVQLEVILKIELAARAYRHRKVHGPLPSLLRVGGDDVQRYLIRPVQDVEFLAVRPTVQLPAHRALQQVQLPSR